MKYGNRPSAPVIEPGQRATFHSVRGRVNVRVIGIVHDLFHRRDRVRVEVIDDDHPLYREGEGIDCSPTWLEPAPREWEATVVHPDTSGDIVWGTLDEVIDRLQAFRITSPDCRITIRSIA